VTRRASPLPVPLLVPRLAPLLAGVLLVSGCGLLPSAEPEQNTAKVVVLGAAGTASGRAALDAVRSAVDAAAKPPGWTVEVVAEDDGGDPERTAAIAERLGDDEELLAVVGPLEPGRAVTVQEQVLGEDVVQLVPADTRTVLTRGADPAEPVRPFASLFRPVANDDAQAAVAATYVTQTLGATKVAAVTDGTPRGDAQVAAFRSELAARDLAVAEPLVVTTAKQRAGAVTALEDSRAKVVYVGGTAQAAAELSTAAGPHRGWSLLTGDAIPLAGRGPEGLRVGDAATAPSTGSDGNPLTRAVADSATALGLALTECLPGPPSMTRLRDRCVAAVAQVAFEGAGGTIAFDDYGDLSLPRATVLRATEAGWDAALTADAVPAAP
jgi:branched-chain amino acid transport system substrate-binding protein